ncbi:hypothetical protein U9M48_009468 [Paspalum notatum var. saurae]|uniref:Uncharacterized protein n=1 Tax=Paspalum notatum var. saurae TaxID=547442 RepID=A0AAQ3SRJ8_PASNO
MNAAAPLPPTGHRPAHACTGVEEEALAARAGRWRLTVGNGGRRSCRMRPGAAGAGAGEGEEEAWRRRAWEPGGSQATAVSGAGRRPDYGSREEAEPRRIQIQFLSFTKAPRTLPPSLLLHAVSLHVAPSSRLRRSRPPPKPATVAALLPARLPGTRGARAPTLAATAPSLKPAAAA